MTETPSVQLRAHQMIMLELLRELDGVCRRNGISYSLFAGTMLGAVREHGFIPWDDDLDVVMLRSDYQRFLDAAERELDHAKIIVQREFTAHWPMQSSKLRCAGTTCLEKYYPKDPQTHRGIYIDVFPCDALSDNALVARLQFFASKIVIAKALDARGYVTNSRLKKLALTLSRLVPLKPFRRLVLLGERQDTSRVHTFFGGSKQYRKSVYPRAWFQRFLSVPFEDGQFPISADYDALLTTLYGDYHTPPSEPLRSVKAHAFFVDTQRDYTEFPNAYDGVTFEVLTQSTR